jgi:hypothetical protein
MIPVLIEALVVGVVTVAVFAAILAVLSRWGMTWPILLTTAFLTGALVHILCELFGVNKWYCKSGNACRAVAE